MNERQCKEETQNGMKQKQKRKCEKRIPVLSELRACYNKKRSCVRKATS